MIYAHRQTDRQTDRHTYTPYMHTDTHHDACTQTDRQTDRQTDTHGACTYNQTNPHKRNRDNAYMNSGISSGKN